MYTPGVYKTDRTTMDGYLAATLDTIFPLSLAGCLKVNLQGNIGNQGYLDYVVRTENNAAIFLIDFNILPVDRFNTIDLSTFIKQYFYLTRACGLRIDIFHNGGQISFDR